MLIRLMLKCLYAYMLKWLSNSNYIKQANSRALVRRTLDLIFSIVINLINKIRRNQYINLLTY